MALYDFSRGRFFAMSIGREATMVFARTRDGHLYIEGEWTAEDVADSYWPDMMVRFKLLELDVKLHAQEVLEDVLAKIKRDFECLNDGHDLFSVHDSQGDGLYWQNFSYLECRHCGEVFEYDGRDDYGDYDE